MSNFFSNIDSKILSWFQKEKPVVEHAFTTGNNVINIVKTFIGSATGQTLEVIIEILAPGTANVVFSLLNRFFVDFGLIHAEAAKTPSQLAADGFNAIANLTGISKIIALHNVASIIGHGISTINGGGSTIQQAIVSLPIVHNPNVLQDATNEDAVPAPPETPATNFVQPVVQSDTTPPAPEEPAQPGI